MKNDHSTIIIIALILAAALFYNSSSFFGINLKSSEVQYYNEGIHAEFELQNYTNPTIKLFLDNREINEYDINDTNQSISFTRNIVNGTYDLYVEGINDEGTLKIVVSEGNITETKVIDVQQPYVAITHNIPNTAEEGDSIKISVLTTTPQGEFTDADSVVIDLTYPDSSLDTLTLTKSGETYEYNFNYENVGTYQFKIKAMKEGFKTKEFSAVTTVISTGGIHPVVWIIIFAAIIWAIFFGIKFVRTR